jgi:hypothetical protein
LPITVWQQIRLGPRPLCGADGAVNRFDVVTVDLRDDVPAVGLEAPRGIVAEPAFHLAVDGDPVVVVERDELAQGQDARERTGLVRDALHQAAVAHRHVGVMVNELEARAVELGGEEALRERHADRVRQPLPERTGRGLHAGREAVLGVSGRLGVQLAKALDLLHRQVVARQMQEGVEQHRAVAVGEHEAVAAGPPGIGGIVAQVPPPQRSAISAIPMAPDGEFMAIRRPWPTREPRWWLLART